MSYSVPPNEVGRLAAVRALNIVGTPPEIAFDEISELAAQISQCPVSYITFADDNRFWLKAKYGLPPDFNECPREISFCATTICGTVMVIAPNLREDSRFSQFELRPSSPARNVANRPGREPGRPRARTLLHAAPAVQEL